MSTTAPQPNLWPSGALWPSADLWPSGGVALPEPGQPPPVSPYADELLDSLPNYYRSDPYAMAVINALAAALGRLHDFLDAMRQQFFPQYADDTYGLLGIWEAQLGLPVAPPSLSLDQRRSRVLGVIRGRRVGYGSDWTAALTAFLGSSQWTVQENTPGAYQITVLIPATADPFTTGQVQTFLRAITPAHQDLTVGLLGGFIVDVGIADETALQD